MLDSHPSHVEAHQGLARRKSELDLFYAVSILGVVRTYCLALRRWKRLDPTPTALGPTPTA